MPAQSQYRCPHMRVTARYVRSMRDGKPCCGRLEFLFYCGTRGMVVNRIDCARCNTHDFKDQGRKDKPEGAGIRGDDSLV